LFKELKGVTVQAAGPFVAPKIDLPVGLVCHGSV
jgi:hypothetical protein